MSNEQDTFQGEKRALKETSFRPSIQVQNIQKEFVIGENTIPVLRDISFDIVQGDFAMIVGPSGCGKSTLLNIINGWMLPSSGEVLIQNQNIYDLNEDKRVVMYKGLVSMIHQSSFWIKSLSVLENIAIPYMLAGKDKNEAKERANKLLKILAFEKYGHYRPMDLSGGQQQRISFLRALINNPKILMADEPTGNLDSKTSVFVMDLFKEINEKFNRTLIMVTHNMELLNYATKVIKIRDGKVEDIKENIRVKPKVMGMMSDLVDVAGNGLEINSIDEQPKSAEEAVIQAKLEQKMKKEDNNEA